jgi:predicted DNA-binding ribbon-helix-helix protein
MARMKMIRRSFALKPTWLAMLEEIAKSRKCTVSDLMRQAVRNILRVAGKKEREL